MSVNKNRSRNTSKHVQLRLYRERHLLHPRRLCRARPRTQREQMAIAGISFQISKDGSKLVRISGECAQKKIGRQS